MAEGGSNRKVANSLVAAGTAAVMAVYAAGYARTRSAADQLEAQSAARRPAAAPASGQTARGPAPSAAPVAAQSVTASESTGAPTQVATLEHAAPMTPTPVAPLVPEQKTEVPVAPSAPSPAPVAPVAAPVATPSAPAPTPVATAAAPAPAAAPAAPQPAAKWKDGTFKGWGTCRHGDIEAQVVIEAGRITSATISQCLTRYSCDIIGRLPPEVIQRQSGEVDYVSGATESANAFYYAVLEALGKAK